MLRVLALVLRLLVVLLHVLLLLEGPQLLLRLPVVVVLQVARRLVQRRRLLVWLEGQPLAMGCSEWRGVVLAPLQSQCSLSSRSEHQTTTSRCSHHAAGLQVLLAHQSACRRPCTHHRMRRWLKQGRPAVPSLHQCHDLSLQSSGVHDFWTRGAILPCITSMKPPERHATH